MILFSILTPHLLSLALGYCVLNLIKRTADDSDPLVSFFLAAGLGLGLSSAITFSSFVLLNQLSRAYCIILHALILFICTGKFFLSGNAHHRSAPRKKSLPDAVTLVSLALLMIAMLPVWMQARQYPFGGWDAWGVWNFKAKFLFLAKDNWTHMLDPVLWRSSPHYPLLLPLINVWGWAFSKAPSYHIPFWTGLAIVFYSSGLLYSIVKRVTKSAASVLPCLLLLTLPFYILMAVSQYSDILLGYFLLAGLYCFYEFNRTRLISWGILAGAFLGLLCFTKPEGFIAAFLALGLNLVLLLTEKADHRALSVKARATALCLSFVLFAVPAFIFIIKYSPGNQTFINGLTSSEQPSDWMRLKLILGLSILELLSPKWNGVWIYLALGWLFGITGSLKREYRVIPLFLASYLAVILAYYFVNTHFEITWWVSVTLHRILISLLPTFLFWIMLSLWQDKTLPDKEK